MTDPNKAAETTGDHNDSAMPDANVASQLMRDPQVLAALQERLGSIVGTPSGYVQSLPKPVQRRIKALKNLQLECCNIEAEFYKEVHEIECRYLSRYQKLYDRRTLVVSGEYEPTDAEADFKPDALEESNGDQQSLDDEQKKAAEVAAKLHGMDDSTKGIPEFWLTTLKNVDLVSEMIQEHDEPILKHLTDIKLTFGQDPMSFSLAFHFSSNEFFTDSVLNKSYEMKCGPGEVEPFTFEGPEIIKCKGCEINWNNDKNVTLKVVKKKQKHKSRGSTRFVTKTVKNDSFFNFFNPPTVPDDPEAELDEDSQNLLTADFEIGHYIRERIVPRAVLFFTGDMVEEEDEFESDEEEEDGEEEEDSETDPDFDPSKKGTKQEKRNPEECKQQ